MAKTKYSTEPIKTTGMPPGVPYIVANEAAERFSYYGMRSILVIFMTQYLMNKLGQQDTMTDEQAKSWYHLFIGSVYFFPLLGALLADACFGKYLTILSLSVVYCLGHLALALDTTRMGLVVGLTLIAIGSGGIKPCVSAHVGDQFSSLNQRLLPKVFSWFYFSINFGSAISTLLIPFLLDRYGPEKGPHIAFGVPGLLMLMATWFFWLGRYKFAHIQPDPQKFGRDLTSPDTLQAIGKLAIIFLFIAVFWSLYDQSSSAWVLQAKQMDRHLFGKEWLPAQIQAANPILILIYIPLFTYVIYPLINKVFPLTPLRKIGLGFLLAAASFLIPAWIEVQIKSGQQPNIVYQLLAYSLLIAGEIMVSITGLEFSYTQAPRNAKSVVMALYLLSITLGNLLTSAVNFFIQNPDKTSKISGATYYLFFAGLMFATAIGFIFVARRYQPRTYLQGEEETTASA